MSAQETPTHPGEYILMTIRLTYEVRASSCRNLSEHLTAIHSTMIEIRLSIPFTPWASGRCRQKPNKHYHGIFIFFDFGLPGLLQTDISSGLSFEVDIAPAKPNRQGDSEIQGDRGSKIQGEARG